MFVIALRLKRHPFEIETGGAGSAGAPEWCPAGLSFNIRDNAVTARIPLPLYDAGVVSTFLIRMRPLVRRNLPLLGQLDLVHRRRIAALSA
jgi:hypothetical protein